MGDNLFEKFNNMIDVDGLKHDVEEAANGDFVEVPHGDYEVQVSKLELGQTGERSKTPGMPMAKVWYDIIAGDFKGQKIFQNQMLTTGFGIHRMNELLNSFETGIPVAFNDFKQYGELLKEIFEAVDGKAEFQLAYGKNSKGYSTYEIVQKF